MSEPNAKIGLRNIISLRAGQTVWDGSVSGLAARRQASSVISYIVMYRTTAGRKRTYTIGKHGSPWMPETARQEARRILGEVAKGADPMADKIAGRKAVTVAELCREYLIDVEAGRLLTRRQIAKKESTLISDRGRITRHIIPLLGRKSVASITRNDVEDFMHDVAEGRRQRRLTDDEYRRLGMALSKADQAEVWKAAVDATRLMIITGWRRGEVLGLRWSEVDLPRRTARLADTKTGASLRPLSDAACELISAQPRNCDVVFASRSDEVIGGYRKMWLKIAKLSDLPADITPHVLRHSFASLAADLGYNEPTIASLLGHKTHSITSRYMHSADAVLLAAADAVADATMKLMAADQGQPQLRKQRRDGSVVWDEFTVL